MEFHNIVEDTVIAKVNEIFMNLEADGNKGKFCTCSQCRIDIICYALNRIPPHYIVSSRGVSRALKESIQHLQETLDIESLIYEGLKLVNVRLRPNFAHSPGAAAGGAGSNTPVFNIPTIMGRILNGNNFEPMANIDIDLLLDGNPVPMIDGNWQNPCRLVPGNEGNYTFWPAPVPGASVGEKENFEYTLRVTAPGFEPLIRVFTVPVVSEVRRVSSFNLARTFKLPDLYMFPPGEDEHNRYLVD